MLVVIEISGSVSEPVECVGGVVLVRVCEADTPSLMNGMWNAVIDREMIGIQL